MTTPREDWWLIVRYEGVSHLWQIGDPDPARTADLVDRARVLVGVPPGDGTSGDVGLLCGQPHERLMANATVHELSDLDRVTAEAVAAYRTAGEVERGHVRVDAARQAMLRLTLAERAQVIGEIPPRTTGGAR